MRSEQIHRALAQGYSRFQICQPAALFNVGVEATETAEESTPSGRIGE